MSSPIPEFGKTLETAHTQAKASYAKEKSRVTKATQEFEAVFIGYAQTDAQIDGR